LQLSERCKTENWRPVFGHFILFYFDAKWLGKF